MTTSLGTARTPALARVAAAPGQRVEVAYLSVLFVVLTALAALFPVNGDDWAWVVHLGIERWDSHFRDYNGRYAGNVAVLLLTRSAQLAPLVVAGVVCASIWLVQDLTRNRTLSGYLLTTLLLLGMPLTMWRESVSWISGFSNYVLAGLAILLFLRSASADWAGVQRRRGFRAVVALPLGVVSALFVEHVTIYLVAAAAANVAGQVRVRRRSSLPSLLWLGGLALGAALMFSNGAYRMAASGTELTRGILPAGDSAGLGVYDQLTRIVSRMAVVDNTALNWVVVLLVLLLVWVRSRSLARARWIWLPPLAGLFLALAALLHTSTFSPDTQNSWAPWAGLAALLFLVLVGGAASTLGIDRERSLQLVVCLASVVVLALPLMVVTPIGPRCFYPAYLLLVAVASLLVRELVSQTGVEPDQLVAPFLGALVVASLAGFFLVYLTIRSAAIDRLALIRAEVRAGVHETTVYRLPYSSWVHVPDPVGDPWEERFKDYYRIPQQVSIRVVARPRPVEPQP